MRGGVSVQSLPFDISLLYYSPLCREAIKTESESSGFENGFISLCAGGDSIEQYIKHKKKWTFAALTKLLCIYIYSLSSCVNINKVVMSK